MKPANWCMQPSAPSLADPVPKCNLSPDPGVKSGRTGRLGATLRSWQSSRIVTKMGRLVYGVLSVDAFWEDLRPARVGVSWRHAVGNIVPRTRRRWSGVMIVGSRNPPTKCRAGFSAASPTCMVWRAPPAKYHRARCRQLVPRTAMRFAAFGIG